METITIVFDEVNLTPTISPEPVENSSFWNDYYVLPLLPETANVVYIVVDH